jgi:predicted molibdopterin-dependent oxidoreductase YjgC
MIAVELAARLGENLGFLSLEEIWAEMERLAPAFAGIDEHVLGQRAHRDGVIVPLTTSSQATTADIDASADPTSTPGLLHPETQGPTDAPARAAEAEAGDGDDDIEPEGGAEASDAGAGRPSLLTWTWSGETASPPKLDAYKVRLVAGRKLYDGGVMLSMAPSLATLAAPPVLKMHPTDLERLGVPKGGSVRVRSNKVTIEAIAVEGDPFQPRGTAGVPFNVPGVDTAALLSADASVVEIVIETVP